MRVWIWTNKKQILCVLILGGFVLMLNYLTPYVADDFQYMYSFADGKRIQSVAQIFPSLYHHYMNEIGRIVPHFGAQLFLMMPKWIFNWANTICFLILCLLFQYAVFPRRRFSAILWFVISVLFWQFVPCFGQVFLWEDGALNYLWAYTLGVCFTLPYLQLFLRGRKSLNQRWKLVLFSIFALLYGNYSENVSFSTIFISAILLLIVMIRSRAFREYAGYIVPIVCGAIGYLFILFSPGEASHVGNAGFGVVFKNMISLCEDFYASQKILLVLWAVLLVAVVYFKRDRRVIWFSVALMAITVINILLLGFGSYQTERAFASGSIFLIWSDVVLLQLLCGGNEEQNRNGEGIALCISMYFIAGSLLNIWNGSYDIYETNRRNSEREAYIQEQVQEGVSELTVWQIEPATTYCAKYGVADVMTREQEVIWLNKAMARYYGLEMIWGE